MRKLAQGFGLVAAFAFSAAAGVLFYNSKAGTLSTTGEYVASGVFVAGLLVFAGCYYVFKRAK